MELAQETQESTRRHWSAALGTYIRNNRLTATGLALALLAVLILLGQSLAQIIAGDWPGVLSLFDLSEVATPAAAGAEGDAVEGRTGGMAPPSPSGSPGRSTASRSRPCRSSSRRSAPCSWASSP